MSIGTSVRRIAQVDQRMDGYLLGLRHGITLAELDDWYKQRIAEINETMLAFDLNELENCNGKTGRTKDHQGD